MFKLKIIPATLGLLSVGILGLFLQKTYFSKAISFEYHQDLSPQEVSDQVYNAVLETHRDCFENTRRRNLRLYLDKYYGSSPTSQVERMLEQSRIDLAKNFRKTKNVYIARQQGNIIGLFSCRPENEVTHGSVMIFNVCLKSSMRGQGFGNILMAHAQEHCKQEGKDLTLTVYKDDKKVVDFYLALGYAIVSDLKDWDEDFSYFNKYLMKLTPKSK